ncbi:hypothetical protein HAHE_05230 [Haloferula helveola]|uniref:Uncharacterized protein n=1 Tax=Haloferula helveola TaxID=490095 RepID=A0ABN6GZ92_9BACT|nr:hypothetical protein HAHE_05230 [Haloferula helveola]
MRAILIAIAISLPASAENVRVTVDGAGCRTRQLAIQRIWEKLPSIDEVEILPHDERPADNQRIFVLNCPGDAPSREQLIEALGRRAKHYRVLRVMPEGQ